MADIHKQGLVEDTDYALVRSVGRTRRDVLANDLELKSGILRVGEGPGTIHKILVEHCRRMLETKGCFLYGAPVVVRHFVGLFGTDKAAIGIETIEKDTGARRVM